jgi:ABC-2 type transport system permease protein
VTPVLAGVRPLYRRRVALGVRDARTVVGQVAIPVLWVLVVGPALDTALGGLDPGADYDAYLAVGQVALVVTFTAMFGGDHVIAERAVGITPVLGVAPIGRSSITVANAFAVASIAIAQSALVAVLALARGASITTSPAGIAWAAAAATLLTVSVYGIAETLALQIGRHEGYGPLVPVVGVAPWLLSGALFPLAVLPPVVAQLAALSPWAHAVAVLRHGLAPDSGSGLADIWHLGSPAVMATLSTALLVATSWASLTVAARTFRRSLTT